MPRRDPGRRRKSIRRSAENCNGHGCKNCAPVPPAGNLGQIVRPHQPDKAITWKNTPQGAKRINRVAGFKLRFKIRHPDAGVPGNGPGTGHAICQRRHAFFRLQWILRRNKPPHLIEGQGLHGKQADMAVPIMGRVERTAKKPDAQIGAPNRCNKNATFILHVQGRTCPSPRT